MIGYDITGLIRGSADAIAMMFENLPRHGIPLSLLSQYMPDLYDAVRNGRIPCTPDRLVNEKITGILDKYAQACGDAKEI